MKPSNPSKPLSSSRPLSPVKPSKPAKSVKADEGPVRAATLLEERRRCQRVMVRMTAVLHVPGNSKEITALTVAVSENGAMLLLQEPLAVGTKLVVENPRTQKRAGASVTRTPQVTAEGALVPIEFAEPAPAFWQIFFPPAAS